jgi:hypothetical protein
VRIGSGSSRDKTDERVSRVRDRRVREHALDVVLDDRDDVAERHRENRHDDEHVDPELMQVTAVALEAETTNGKPKTKTRMNDAKPAAFGPQP